MNKYRIVKKPYFERKSPICGSYTHHYFYVEREIIKKHFLLGYKTIKYWQQLNLFINEEEAKNYVAKLIEYNKMEKEEVIWTS